MGNIISVIQQSGGVGKSTAVFNISHILADKNYKVLAIDNDIQSDLMPFFFGRDENSLNTIIPVEVLTIKNSDLIIGKANTNNLYKENEIIKPIKIKKNLFYLGATKHLSNVLNQNYDDIVYNFIDNLELLKKEYDFILIDCPPTESNLQKCALMASDNLLIPTHIEPKSIGGIGGTIQLYNKIKKIKNRTKQDINILGIFVSMFSTQDLQLEKYYKTMLNELYGNFLLNTQISQSIRIKESSAISCSIVDYVKQNKGSKKSAEQYINLVNEILSKVGV